MTKNRRYEAHYDALNDARIEQVGVPPCTLPMQAYGPEPVEWKKPAERRPVWAWVTWPHKPAERIAATALGWNDRVCVVEWNGPTGTVNTVVWRNAVSHRQTHESAPQPEG